MTEKKSESQEKEAGHVMAGMSELLVQGLFGGLRSIVSGAVETAERFVGNVTRKVAQGVLFTFCALVGLVYLFSGIADWLNATYQFPGIGGLAIGGVLLFVALVLYLMSRDNK